MKPEKSLEWLERLSANQWPENEEEVKNLLECDEGQFLDRKSGKKTEEPKKFLRMVREYVGGFANAEGGILFVGPSDEDPMVIEPPSAPGGKTVEEWVGDSLLDHMGPHLVPFPRVRTIEYDGKPVLVVVVSRSARLCPVIEGNRWLYYFRFGKSTVLAPDYLVSDLLVGRKAIPYLHVMTRNPQISRSKEPSGDFKLTNTFLFNVENQALVTAEDVTAGIISWSRYKPRIPVSQYLSANFDAIQPKASGPWYLTHQNSTTQGGSEITIRPFQTVEGITVGPFRHASVLHSRIQAAFYILSRNASPTWLQFNFGYNCDQESGQQAVYECELRSPEGARPILTYEEFN